MDPCVGPKGEDLCHLARGPPKVDFRNIEKQKKQTVRTVEEASKFIKKTHDAATVSGKDKTDMFFDGLKHVTPKHSHMLAMRTAMPLKPTIKTIPKEVMDKAKMCEASKIANDKGFAAAQEYLDEQMIPFDIDVELSTKQSLVLVGDEGVKIAYRGTKPKLTQTGLRDLSADAMIAAGTESAHPIFKNAKAQLAAVKAKFGAISELLGFSLGGTEALTLGLSENIPTQTFNPGIGKNLIRANKTDVPHRILRTTEDPISFGLGLTKRGTFQIDSILPHADKLNPLESHKLENFTKTSKRRAGFTEDLLDASQRAGQRAGEYDMLRAIKDAQFKNQSFTEWVHEFNGRTGSDTTPDGTALRGTRNYKGSKWVKHWEETAKTTEHPELSSKPFTAAEEAHFKSVEEGFESPAVNDKPVLSPQDRAKFVTSTPTEQERAITKAHETLHESMRVADAHMEPYKSSVNAVKRAVSPTNLGAGIVGGVVASQTMDKLIDPDHKIEEHGRTAIEGGLSGVTTELGVAAMTGAAVSSATVLPAAVAGAGAYLAGSETQKAVTRAMTKAHIDHNVAEATGSATGGAVGGVVGAGTVIGGAALMGTEIGSVGGPVGVAIGAGIGSVVGVASWAFGKLFGGHHKHK
jgi:hypothetical protein